ncbi:MAG: ribonuclease III domain-containing protein [Candidatus Hodarchaeales archaeon]|jgi:ribonuclease-3
MEKRLTWNAIGLERKTKILIDEVSRTFRKLQLYLDELNYIKTQIENIHLELIPSLETIFRLKFPTPELVMLALARPSIRNIFIDLKGYFEKESNSPLKIEEYDELAASGEATNVLALIGDAILDLTVVQIMWDSSLSTVGKLSIQREEIVSNQNLAKVCDKWRLYEYRLCRLHDPTAQEAKEKTIQHEKGTLVEAIFGVIYMEFGVEHVVRVLPHVQYP